MAVAPDPERPPLLGIFLLLLGLGWLLAALVGGALALVMFLAAVL